MPTRNPRVNVVLDDDLFAILSEVSECKQKTLSSLAKELIIFGLEKNEDIYLSNLSEKRLLKYSSKKQYLIGHDKVWK